MNTNLIHSVRVLFAIIASSLLLLTVSCSSMGAPPKGPQVVHNYQPSDLPIPLNFRFSDNPSDSWAEITFANPPLSIRTGQFVYFGERPIQELQSWYTKQMPLEGWSLESSDHRNDIQLRFTKGRENCEITLERIPDDRGEFYLTRLTARIRPN